jgi:leader peptidase (prepilin peptidase)/N-methyltransferase
MITVLALPSSAWLAAGVLSTLLIAAAWLDLVDGTVHVVVVIPLTLAGFVAAATALPPALHSAAAGAVLGYGLFRLLEWAFRRLGARDGLGRGDAWLLGASGTWVGPSGLAPLVLIAASLTLAGVLLRYGPRPARDTEVPFAPGLAAATWLVWISGVSPVSGIGE